jgi:hypothetical protein
MATVNLISNTDNVQITVGYATTSGAAAGSSTSVVSGTTVSLPHTSPSYYIAAFPAQNDTNNKNITLTGFALSAPGAGTFYYTIWASSDTSHNYSEMAATLSVLSVTP